MNNEIITYLHCQRCLQELPGSGTSARDYARLEVGITRDGSIQIWCLRHRCNVAKLDASIDPARLQ